MALISDRIFELIKERGMTQKQFAELTNIAESTISDWKRRGANPASEKIMIICEVLQVTPEELLSGSRPRGDRSRIADVAVVYNDSEEGQLLLEFESLNRRQKDHLIGYLKALSGTIHDSVK